MIPHTVDTIALGPTRNLQGGIYYFSLVTSKFLNRAWCNVKIYKILLNAISYLNYIMKK